MADNSFILTARFCDRTVAFKVSEDLADYARAALAILAPSDGVLDIDGAWAAGKVGPSLERLTREVSHYVGVPLESGKTFAAQVAATSKKHAKSAESAKKATK